MRRATKRQSLIDATVAELEKVQRMVARGRLRDRGEIGIRVGRLLKASGSPAREFGNDGLRTVARGVVAEKDLGSLGNRRLQ